MKAIGFTQSLNISEEQSLFEFELDQPIATNSDILVEVKAISVNPVDGKVRRNAALNNTLDTPRILGFDAAGVVVGVGDQVKNYKLGDEVYYAGDITKSGSNQQFQVVDEAIVGNKPKSLSFSQAAAIPLTAITAYEALFERLSISKNTSDKNKTILIVGGAGGVGSIAIQLVKKLTQLQVIATASKAESIEWVKQLGADYVINHRNDLNEEIKHIGITNVDYILCLSDTDGHWHAMCKVLKPQGAICTIVENAAPLDMNILKTKSAKFSFEFMFTRSIFNTPDKSEQQRILNEVAQLIDEQVIVHTQKHELSPINVSNLKKAHLLSEQGQTLGKITLHNWE